MGFISVGHDFHCQIIHLGKVFLTSHSNIGILGTVTIGSTCWNIKSAAMTATAHLPSRGYSRRFFAGVLSRLLLVVVAVDPAFAVASEKAPLLIGIDAEFGLQKSTSAQNIELGARAAINEINQTGGLLGGRKLQLVIRDNRSIPARGVENLRSLAAMPDLVAVLGGRFSPVVIEQLPLIAEKKIPFLAVWSSAEQIIANKQRPNYVFRVSLHDGLAMPFMLEHAAARGLDRVGLLLSNTAWGRSNLAAAEAYAKTRKPPKIVRSEWFSWADTTLISKYRSLVSAGAKAIILVSNDEAAVLIKEMAALPESERLPLIAHWGLTGGDFVQQAGPALGKVDISVLQTFSFHKADPRLRERFLKFASLDSSLRIEDIASPAGAAQAYDAVHLLALAITRAGSTDRSRIRDALEQLPPHRGLVKHYQKAFTPSNHEALGRQELLMTYFRSDGMVVPR